MKTVKKINSDDSNKKITSNILQLLQVIGIIFIGKIIIDFISTW